MSKHNLNPKDNIIFCKVVLSGPRGSRIIDMILDTGATITTIPTETAIAIGCSPIKSKRKIELITASGIEYAPVVTVSKLKIFTFELRNIDVVCHDLPPQSLASGLLGLDILKQFNIHLDFLDNSLEFLDK